MSVTIMENITGIIYKGLQWFTGTGKSHCGSNNDGYALFIASTGCVVLVVYVITNQKNKIEELEKRNHVLEKQNQELEKRNKVLEKQNQELEKRNQVLETLIKKTNVIDQIHQYVLDLKKDLAETKKGDTYCINILSQVTDVDKLFVELTDKNKVKKKQNNETEEVIRKEAKEEENKMKVDHATQKQDKTKEVIIKDAKEDENKVKADHATQKKDNGTKEVIVKDAKEEENKLKADHATQKNDNGTKEVIKDAKEEKNKMTVDHANQKKDIET